MKLIEIKWLPCREGAKEPTQASSGSAGWDVYVPEDTKLHYGRNKVPTGLKVALPDGYRLDPMSKSGMGAKGLLVYEPLNNREIRIDADVLELVVDSDYRGEVFVVIYARDPLLVSGNEIVLKAGQQFAQFVLSEVPCVEWKRVDNLDETERGENGFGRQDEVNDEKAN